VARKPRLHALEPRVLLDAAGAATVADAAANDAPDAPAPEPGPSADEPADAGADADLAAILAHFETSESETSGSEGDGAGSDSGTSTDSDGAAGASSEPASDATATATASADLALPDWPVTDKDTPFTFGVGNNPADDVITVGFAGTESVTLTADHGSFTALGDTSGLDAFSGLNTDTLVLTGTEAAVNTALDGLTYSPDANFAGMDTLRVEVAGAIDTTTMDVQPVADGRASIRRREIRASTKRRPSPSPP